MGCGGQEMDFSWENVIPPWQQPVAEAYGAQLLPQVGEGATPLPEEFPLAPRTDLMQLAAMNTMSQLGGYEYGEPGWIGMGGDYGSGPGPAFAGASGPNAVTASYVRPVGPPAVVPIAGPAQVAAAEGPSRPPREPRRGPVTRAVGAQRDAMDYIPYYSPDQFLAPYGDTYDQQPMMPPWFFQPPWNY